MKAVLKAVTVASFWWLSACGGVEAGGGFSGRQVVAPAASAATEHRTLARHAPTKVSLQTIPNATCDLGADGFAKSMRVHSDDRGVVSFNAHPVAEQDRTVELSLRCHTASGAEDSRRIQLDLGEVASPESDQVEAQAGLQPNAYVRPALTEDPNTLTSQELLKRGYPPRPNSDMASGAYDRWLSEVTHPMTIIPPALVDSGKVHRPAQINRTGTSTTSNNWSGLVLHSSVKYAALFGWFHVPNVQSVGTFWHEDSSCFWVGLGGWGEGDLVQDGSESDTGTYFWVETSSYYPWAEVLPANQSTVSNFNINPGDELGAWTIWADQNYNITINGDRGWFELINYSTGQSTGLFTITEQSTSPKFTGDTAEWILERTDYSSGYAQLSNYGTAQMHDMVAFDFSLKTHEWTTDPYYNVTMTNNGDTLSSMSIVDEYDADFTWHNHE